MFKDPKDPLGLLDTANNDNDPLRLLDTAAEITERWQSMQPPRFRTTGLEKPVEKPVVPQTPPPTMRIPGPVPESRETKPVKPVDTITGDSPGKPGTVDTLKNLLRALGEGAGRGAGLMARGALEGIILDQQLPVESLKPLYQLKPETWPEQVAYQVGHLAGELPWWISGSKALNYLLKAALKAAGPSAKLGLDLLRKAAAPTAKTAAGRIAQTGAKMAAQEAARIGVLGTAIQAAKELVSPEPGAVERLGRAATSGMVAGAVLGGLIGVIGQAIPEAKFKIEGYKADVMTRDNLIKAFREMERQGWTQQQPGVWVDSTGRRAASLTVSYRGKYMTLPQLLRNRSFLDKVKTLDFGEIPRGAYPRGVLGIRIDPTYPTALPPGALPPGGGPAPSPVIPAPAPSPVIPAPAPSPVTPAPASPPPASGAALNRVIDLARKANLDPARVLAEYGVRDAEALTGSRLKSIIDFLTTEAEIAKHAGPRKEKVEPIITPPPEERVAPEKGEVRPTKKPADIQDGQTVYHPKTGEALTVVDTSDPSLLKVRNTGGKIFSIGRNAVKLESPEAKVSPIEEAKPEIAAEMPKEPWQMTFKEFFNVAGSKYTATERFGIPKERIHRAVIRKALSEGKPVPPEVLKEYPDLKPADVKAEIVPTGKTVTAKTERGTAIEAKYAVVEADSLVASHDTRLKENPAYPKELQPRDRTRMASELQINRIVQKLEPEFLGESPKVSEGAPIVGKDGIVESGNARIIALQRLYEQKHKNAELYKNWIKDNAEKFGIDKETLKTAKNPVLVRIRQTDIDRVKFTQEANEQAVAAMSASEQAQADAKKLTGRLMEVFNPSESGDIVTAGNRRFISGFLSEVVSEAERGKYITKDGSISQEGVVRIRNAVFAKAYGDTGAIEKLAESTDTNVKNQINAMLIAAPRLIKLNEAMDKGELYDLNISHDLAAAMNKLSYLRETGQTVDNYLRQMSFVEDLSPLAKEVLYVFDKHKRSSKRIASILQAYADSVELAGNPKQQTIFAQNPPSKEEIWAHAVRKAEGLDEEALQTTIFQSQGMGIEGVGPEREAARETASKAEGVQKAVGPAPKLKKAEEVSREIPLIKRRDIVSHLSEKLDIPIRVGRFRQRARGIFKQKPEVIRTKLANDIPTISHEVGHYLDKKFGLSKTGAFDAELLPLGKQTSKPSYTKQQIRKEGVAEFMRLYLTDPQSLPEKAPRYYAEFEAIMAANPEIHDVLLQARRDIQNWLSQPAKARVLGSISVGEKTARKMTFDRLYSAAVDELRPLQSYVKTLFPEGVDFDKDPFLQAWLARGWVGKAETRIHYGVMDKDYNKIGPSLKEILEPVKNKLDDFRAYITAKRAIELHDRDIDSGIDYEDAVQTVKDLETPEFIKAQKELVDFSDSLVDMLVDAEMIDRDTAVMIRSMNKNYVPFYRVFDEMGQTHGYGKTGYANLESPVKRLKGSHRDIIDPLESIIRNVFFFTNVAERNNIGRLVVELAEKREGAGKWVEEVPVSVRPIQVNLSEIKSALEGIGVDVEGLDLERAATIFRPVPFPAAKENILAVWVKGQRRFYQVEPELYRALLALDKETSNMLVNILSKPAAVLRAGATLSPDFMIRNPLRDIMTAMIYSSYGFKPHDFVRGLFHIFKKDDLYWKFHASGAAHGAMVSLDRDYLQGALRGILQTSAKDKAKSLFKSPLELLRALSEYGEMATRLGEFEKGIKTEAKTGKGVRMAALSARDVTLDFARWGYAGKVPNRIIAFFNSSVQGLDKMARSFTGNPKRSLLRCLLYITLPSVILYLLNRDDERYQELPQWEKDLFWIIPTPKHVFRIPKPFELGVIFGTLPERILEYIYTQDPGAFKDYLKTLKDTGLPDIVPTAFTGWIEAFHANRSFYTGIPIVPAREEKLPPELQYGDYTSETAKLIGRVFKVSPRKADHIAQSYGGGLAKYGTKILDQLLKAVGATEKVTKPEPTLAEYPVIGAFSSRVWSNSHSIDKFYDLYAEAEKIYSKKKAGMVLTEKELEKLSRLRTYRSVAEDLSKLRTEGRMIFDDPDLTPQEKREMLDTLNIIQINLARKAIGLSPITVKP
jgi:hypothetical protein